MTTRCGGYGFDAFEDKRLRWNSMIFLRCGGAAQLRLFQNCPGAQLYYTPRSG